MFALYFLLVRSAGSNDFLQEAIVVGIMLRIVATLAEPNLTDDHYRYIWDGQLVMHGINPYAFTPEQVRDAGFFGISALSPDLYANLNSATYHSVYPPVTQAVYAIGAFIGGSEWNTQFLVIKIILFAFECGTLFLLPALLQLLSLPKRFSLWYILNPLIISELTGNMHAEGIMIFLLLLSLYYFRSNRYIFSALAFGIAIATKLWPLMLLPLFFRQTGFRHTLRYALIAGATALLLLFPMIIWLAQITGSLNLYFQQFEFNASIFYIGKYLFNKEENYTAFQIMRASLPFIALAAILLISGSYKKDKLPAAMLAVFSIYLLFATTVHSWYITPLILFAVLSGYSYPFWWSALIMLSYYTYRTPAYIENYYLVAIEYGFVIILAIVEWRKRPLLDNVALYTLKSALQNFLHTTSQQMRR